MLLGSKGAPFVPQTRWDCSSQATCGRISPALCCVSPRPEPCRHAPLRSESLNEAGKIATAALAYTQVKAAHLGTAVECSKEI